MHTFAICVFCLFVPINVFGQATNNSQQWQPQSERLQQTPPRLLPPALIRPTAAAPEIHHPEPKNITVQKFDPRRVDVKWRDHRWELWAGDVWLRDFGKREHEAREAARLIRELQLTERGSIGSPQPVMEFWLSEGRAPRILGGGRGLRLFPMDQSSLHIEQIEGQWCVRDRQRLYFNFGLRKGDAEAALAIIQQHGFDQIGYVGYPNPSMIYFVSSMRTDSIPGNAFKPFQEIKANGNGPQLQQTGKSVDVAQKTNDLAQQYSQRFAQGIPQLAEPVQAGETRIPIDPDRLIVRQDKNGWLLMHGNYVIANFGENLVAAREAMQILRHYRCTERCILGGSPSAGSYFLVNGHAPRGLRFGMRGVHLRPDKLEVRQLGTQWFIMDNERPLLVVGDRKEDAERLLNTIRRYRFDFLAQIGGDGEHQLPFFVRVH